MFMLRWISTCLFGCRNGNRKTKTEKKKINFIGKNIMAINIKIKF